MDQQKKVMHVVECFGGGVLQSVAKICFFTQDDCEQFVTFSTREQTPDNYESLYPKNVIFTPWQAVRQISPAKDFKAVMSLRKIVKKHKPDVLHLHSSKAGALGRIAFPFGGGMKIIYTPRAYGFLQLNLRPWKIIMYRVIEKILGWFPHITVACGQGEYELAKKIARKAEVINNSISTTYLDELAGSRVKNDRFTVLSAGRISYQKNFPQFVEIARVFEDKDVDFVWVGGAAPEDESLPKNMRVTGWMDYEESVSTIAKADIYIQTSLWEGLSLTVLEAMGLGLPVLLSNAVGNKEMVEEGRDGFVCLDVESFVDKITLLKNDNALRKVIGNTARSKIKQDYSHEVCKQQWLDMYGLK